MKILLTSDTHYAMTKHTPAIHEKFLAEGSILAPDLVLHAGDWSATSQNQLGKTLKNFRRAFGAVPIAGVLGNHDLWHKTQYDVLEGRRTTRSLSSRLNIAGSLMRDQDVHWLAPDRPLEASGVMVFGFDGWYAHSDPQTYDRHWLPGTDDNGRDVMVSLQKRSLTQFEQLLDALANARADHPEKKIVVVTHHPIVRLEGRSHPFDGDYNMGARLIDDKLCDVLCMGHSHRRVDTREGDVRLLNAGSDYDKPAWLEFEV